MTVLETRCLDNRLRWWLGHQTLQSELAAFARQFKDVHEFLSELALISNVDAEAAPARQAKKRAVQPLQRASG
jgi:hypothetical protein